MEAASATGTASGERTPLGTEALFDGGLVEVAERTWAWLQPNGGLGESNAGLVVGDGESLLVDTLWDARLTATLLAAVERKSSMSAKNRTPASPTAPTASVLMRDTKKVSVTPRSE